MKLHLPLSLLSAISLLWMAASPCYSNVTSSLTAGKTLHIYILTGQSNSLGSVKDAPASEDLLQQYSSVSDEDSDGILMWNGNVRSGAQQGGESQEGVAWETVAPQWPVLSETGWSSLCMGPEYGFAYMMQHKGWQVSDTEDVAVIKVSRDGGGNSYWLKDGGSQYEFILDTVARAVAQIDKSQYSAIDISGLLYLQGESNSAAETDACRQRYLDLVSNLKEDLGSLLDGMDVTVSLEQSVLGQPASWNGGENYAVGSDGVSTQAKLISLAKEESNIGYALTRDLTKIPAGDTLGVHYDGKSQITIGARYAYAMAMQQGIDVTESGALAVRSQEYESASLNDAAAWWGWGGSGLSAADLAQATLVWDVSSANVADTLSGDLAAYGIRVEDPFRSVVEIARGGNAQATLSIGAGGVELQKGSLAVGVGLSVSGSQEWKVAGGQSLSIGSASRNVSFEGTGTISLERTGEGQAAFSIYASSAGALSLAVNDGVSLSIGGSADYSGVSLSLAGQSDVTLDIEKGTSSFSSLSLGDGAVLTLGSETSASSLSVGSISIGTGVTLNLDLFSISAYDSISAQSWSESSAADIVSFNLNYGSALRGNRDYTLFTGWNENVQFTYNAYIDSETGETLSTLSVVNGNLVLRLGDIRHESWVQDFPTGQVSSTITSSGIYDASLTGGNTLVSDNTASGSVYFFGCSNSVQEAGSEIYSELCDASAAWVAGAGSTSSASSVSLTGNVHVKVSGDKETSYAAAYSVVNGTLDGDSYLELGNENAAYDLVGGVYHGSISGSNTIIISGGTVEGYLIAGVCGSALSATAAAIGDGVYLQIDGGVFKKGAYGGSGVESVINGGTHVQINDGTFENVTSSDVVVTAGGSSNGSHISGGSDLVINGGVFSNVFVSAAGGGSTDSSSLTITGGNFDGCKGIYAGNVKTVSNGSCSVSGGTMVTLSGIDDNNDFAGYTGVLSGGSYSSQGTVAGSKKLVLEAYTVTNLVHSLRDFDSIEVKENSSTSISQDIGLGSAASVSLERDSSLSLVVTDAVSGWSPGVDVTIEAGSTLGKTGEGRLELRSVSGDGRVHIMEGSAALESVDSFTGTLQVAENASAVVGVAITGAASQSSLSGGGRVEFSGTMSESPFDFSDSDWTGTVVLKGNQISYQGSFSAWSGRVVLDLGSFGQRGSTIELDGVGAGSSAYVHFSKGNGSAAADLHLAGTDENGGVGLMLTAGSSNQTYTFSGAWTGNGSFVYDATASQSFKFTGSMLGYEGDMLIGGDNSAPISLTFGEGGTGSVVGSISGVGMIRGTSSKRTVTLHYNYNGEVSAWNYITGNISLAKDGSGMLTLTHANDYTGTTTVSEGMLLLEDEGSVGSGAVSVNAASQGLVMGTGNTLVSLDGAAAAIVSGHNLLSASALAGSEASMAAVANAAISVQGSYSISDSKLESASVTVSGEHGSLTASNLQLGEDSRLDAGSAFSAEARGGSAAVVSGVVTAASCGGEESQAALISGVSAKASDSYKISQATVDNSLIAIEKGVTLWMEDVLITSSTRIVDDSAFLNVSRTIVVMDSSNTTVQQGLQTSGMLELGMSGNAGTKISVAGGTPYAALTGTSFDTVTLTGSSLLLDLSAFGDISTNLFSVTFNNGGENALFDAETLTIQALYRDTLLTGYIEYADGASLVNSTVWFVVPEPATATLSLLALVALAARRRRK